MSKALGAVVFTSTAAMARVVVVCTAGFLLERHGILRASQRKTVAQIVTVCLVPCLIFSSMSFAIQSNRNVEEWAVLPFWAVLHVGFGVGISNLFIWARRKLSAKYDTLPLGGQDEGGEVGGSIVLSPLGSGDDGSGGAGGSGSGSNSNSNPPSRQLLFSMDDAIIIVCVSFPNSGNLPMALGQSVCSVSFDDVFGDADADTCSALVVGYVALYLIIYQPLLWGLAPRFLEAGVATAAITTTRTAAATTAEAAAAMVEAEAEASLSKEGGGGGASQGSAAAAAAASPPPDVAAVAVADAAAGARTAAAKVRGFLSRVPPPIYACLLGLLAGASPPSFLFSESSWLKPAFTDAIVLLGDAASRFSSLHLSATKTHPPI
jgi:predicted permease